MNIEVFKKELSVIVPNELLQNFDYWYKIRDSFEQGYPMMSHSFLSYLYGKYGYDINLLKSQEIISYLLELARGLYEKTYWDVGHINSRPRGISEILGNNLIVFPKVPGTMILPTQKEIAQFASKRNLSSSNDFRWASKPRIKDRNTLRDEIPLAEFTNTID